MMVEGILKGAPLWVWPLFLVLLFFGLKATKQRRAPIWVSYLLPLFGLLSINAVSRLENTSLTLPIFAIAYFTGVIVGNVLQGKWLLSKQLRYVVLAGEWVTLFTMMTIFLANFAAGMLKAINPEYYGSPVFQVIFVTFVAGASGVFLGRGWRVFRFKN